MTRRKFGVCALALAGHSALASSSPADKGYALVERTDRRRILDAAARYVEIAPRTITSYPSPKSPGGLHDFFSQADYFWPNPSDPDGPYVNRDGQSNPANFNDHRKAMIALSIQMPALTAAWMLTGNHRFGQHAADHLRAWFIAQETRMTPNLEFSQGVHGVSTGRSYGIIDTLDLVEVARAASIVGPKLLTASEYAALLDWFKSYLEWMKTSEKGIAERKALNNHAVCWALQAAEFSRLVGDNMTREDIAEQYKGTFLKDQMGVDDSFPKELVRTKPYSYSIFNFDVMVMLCQSLRDKQRDIFEFALPDGRGICKGAAFIYPFLLDKGTWRYKKDVEHFDSLPVRSPGLLFTGLACNRSEYLQLWERLNPDPTDPEIIRSYPVRQPILWF